MKTKTLQTDADKRIETLCEDRLGRYIYFKMISGSRDNLMNIFMIGDTTIKALCDEHIKLMKVDGLIARRNDILKRIFEILPAKILLTGIEGELVATLFTTDKIKKACAGELIHYHDIINENRNYLLPQIIKDVLAEIFYKSLKNGLSKA